MYKTVKTHHGRLIDADNLKEILIESHDRRRMTNEAFDLAIDALEKQLTSNKLLQPSGKVRINDNMQIHPVYSTRQLKSYTCSHCGGSIDASTLTCKYCGVRYFFN